MASLTAEWQENEQGSGFVLVGEGGEHLPWERLDFAEDGLWSFDVVAEHANVDVTTSDEFAPGRPVKLQPEPDNPADPHAIAVLSATGKRAGHVPAHIARRVLQSLPGSETYVLWRQYKNGGHADVRLLMAKQGVALDWIKPTQPLNVGEYPDRRYTSMAGALLTIVALLIILRTCA